MLIVNGADVTDIATDVKLVSPWNTGAARLTFQYPAAKTGMFPSGSVVTLQYGGADLFYGFLTRTQAGRQVCTCTCQDQLFYLAASRNSLMRQEEPLSSFINLVAASVGDRMRLGNVAAGPVMKKKLFDNKGHLDMLYDSMQEALVNTGTYYTLRDRFGALELVDTLDLRIPLVIGDRSLCTDFDYTRGIDEETFNHIRVAKDDKDKGVRNTYEAQDSSAVGKWGRLIHYEKVSTDYNEAQLQALANTLLGLKNRETETLRAEAVGDTRVLGGTGVKVDIAQAGVSLWAVAESVTHQFGHRTHTMTVDLRFGRWS